MSNAIQILLAEISHAFHDVVRPAVMLHPECADDSDIQAFYRYHKWQDIEDEDFDYCPLSFVNAEGFQFLIPAYMRFALKQINSRRPSVDFTIYALNPLGELESFQRSKYVTLTGSQRCAIRHFLEFMADHPELVDADAARKGLEAGWKDVEPDGPASAHRSQGLAMERKPHHTWLTCSLRAILIIATACIVVAFLVGPSSIVLLIMAGASFSVLMNAMLSWSQP